MMDFVVFNVGSNSYALNIENIKRIIQAVKLTGVPNSNNLIEGMMNYENSVIKVLSFRKLIGLNTYDKELDEMFIRLKIENKNWINELKDSVENGSVFTKSVDSHKCELGIWLNNFNSYDDEVSKILKRLIENHRHLYASGGDILELCKSDKNKALELMKTDVLDMSNRVIKDMDIFTDKLEIVANSLQKLFVYEKNNVKSAIKVDSIEDIVQVDENMIIDSDDADNGQLQLWGILNINDNLINVIKNITI